MDGVLGELDGVPVPEASWPPMQQIQAGWDALDDEGRQRVLQRLEPTLDTYEPPADVDQAALRRFYSFLAQMEPIAIEVPLSALPEADDESVPLLERQLADEVFHALLFAGLAEEVGGLDDPIDRAERLLDRIRAPDDRRIQHVLLNLVAEEWFETLFEHAETWGIADDIFRMALADEERHVEEGHVHAGNVDPSRIEPALRAFEDELFRLLQNPRVMLPTLTLAGEEGFRKLSQAYLDTHQEALDELGLEPTQEFQEMADTLEEIQEPGDPIGEISRPERIEPETQWRKTALHLWDTPRNPVMHGFFDVELDHVPTDRLTAVMVAAIGRVWHEYPRVNRYTIGGEVYEPDTVNVGVRVSLDQSQEALSTVVVPDAHERSLVDIERILQAGVREMNELGRQVEDLDPGEGALPLRDVLRDEELMGMVPPETVAAPVTVANSGAYGLSSGVGAMPGALGQSVEIVVGQVEDKPVWNGDRYVPGDVATIGASADHRVIDGIHSAQAMDRIKQALSEEGLAEIRQREDTVPRDANLADVATGEVPVTHQQAQIMMSCKAPFWLGWLCWLFKK